MTFGGMVKNYSDAMRLFDDSQYGKKKVMKKSHNDDRFKTLLENEMSRIDKLSVNPSIPTGNIVDYSA